MKRVRRANTAPEVQVRRILHAGGYRFRLHDRRLPGTPDLVLPKYKLAVFVNGCFWHRHEGCPRATNPKTRIEFWSTKFAANVARDERKAHQLHALKWRSLVIWECEARDRELVLSKVRDALSSSPVD